MIVKKQCKAIVLRSGRELLKIEAPKLKNEILPEKRNIHQSNLDISEKVVEPKEGNIIPKVPIKPYMPPIPFL